MRKNVYVEHNFHKKRACSQRHMQRERERGGGGGGGGEEAGLKFLTTLELLFVAFQLQQRVRFFCFCFVFEKLWCRFTT